MVTLHTGGCIPTDIATYTRQVELFADLLNDMVCAEPVDMLEGDIIATVKALGPPFTSPISSRRRDGRRLSELLDRVVEVRGSLVALARSPLLLPRQVPQLLARSPPSSTATPPWAPATLLDYLTTFGKLQTQLPTWPRAR